MIDRHLGRNSPTFTIEGNPDKYIGLINRHGVLARIMRARRCPCVTRTGSPNLRCALCKGDGLIYDFQRKLLQADEDSDVRSDPTVVYVFRVPMLEPLRVERLLPPEQGGIVEYKIESFDAYTIRISGSPLPKPWQKMRVSYYFDRYMDAKSDRVQVDPNTKTLITTMTRYDAGHRNGNVANVHGDIALITRIQDMSTGHRYQNYTFRGNMIQLAGSEPTPTPGQVEADYFYVPPTAVLPIDLETQNDVEKWITSLSSGNIRFGIEPWYDLGQGDLVTVKSVEFSKDAIVEHSSLGYDELVEFEVTRLEDEIFDERGTKYRKGIDYYLRPYRQIVWIGNQPAVGSRYSVRFNYVPTFRIFMHNPIINRLENKKYPTVFWGKYYNMTMPRDIELMSNTEYAPQQSKPTPIPQGFTEL